MTTDLHMTTTDRLRLVADHIEAHADLWDQSQWTAAGPTVRPVEEAGLGECDTAHCVAGWAVRFTPVDDLIGQADWSGAGRVALGLEPDLARAVFAGGYRPKSMPDVLRLIAELPEGGRTLRAAIDAGLRDLTGANLSRADLSRADLSRANLTGADLSRANLSRADLSRADLSRAYLFGADLFGAYLFGADLFGAYLSRANLSGADLSGAYLSGADLFGADLSRANLSGAYLSGSNANEWTRLPAGCGWKVAGNRVVPDE